MVCIETILITFLFLLFKTFNRCFAPFSLIRFTLFKATSYV
jgi:hypothetical protein